MTNANLSGRRRQQPSFLLSMLLLADAEAGLVGGCASLADTRLWRCPWGWKKKIKYA